jgi:hypothetical protein
VEKVSAAPAVVEVKVRLEEVD